MTKLLKRWSADEGGATAIEYGLIAALIAVGIIGALTAISGGLNATFESLGDTLAGAFD